MRKKFFTALMGTLLFLNSAFAYKVGEQEVEITLSDTYVSRYIWRGQDLYASNDGAQQPSLDVTLPGFLAGIDFGMNVWGSIPINSGHETGVELDYTLTLSKDIGEIFNVSAGYTYFDFPNISSQADVCEPWVSATLNKIPGLPIDISMNIFAGYDFKARSGGPDEGWYYSWGFGTDAPLPKWAIFQEEQALSFGVTNWGNDGVAGLKPSLLYATELSLSTTYEFANFTVTPSINYTINHESAINSGDEEFWGGIEVSYAF